MPGKLDFLRPLYDIAIWQFLIMGKFVAAGDKGNVTIAMTYRMHEVVANILHKLLTLKAFQVRYQKGKGERVKMFKIHILLQCFKIKFIDKRHDV